jgi:hypothetical protein
MPSGRLAGELLEAEFAKYRILVGDNLVFPSTFLTAQVLEGDLVISVRFGARSMQWCSLC